MKSLKADIFTIGIRKKKNEKECSLFNKELLSEFQLIKNPFGKWCADPFLFEHDNKTYLFAELFNSFTRKGSIYVKELSGYKNNKWQKCLIDKCHLSFPNVVMINSKIYMMPETSENEELSLYECVEFPTKWKKVETIFKGLKLVDSIFADNDCYLSYDITNKVRRLLFINNKNISKSLNDDNKILRPAGNVVLCNEERYFPMQICTNHYGEGINVNKHVKDEFETIFKLMPNEIKIKGHSFTGLHTYNYSNNFEVIDLKESKFSLLRIIGKPFRLVFRSRK